MKFVGGLPETRCGTGSTLSAARDVCIALPRRLRDWGIDVVLDAPCGDGNWISTIDLPVAYVGADIDAENLEIARRKRPCRFFVKMDIISAPLPEADLLLCRDFLQHLPHSQVRGFLGNFLASGIPWLLVTSHRNAQNDDISRVGDFRPLNLRSAPFSFPAPRDTIEDGGRDLALWHRTDIDR